MDNSIIILGGKSVEIKALTFKQLKILLPLINATAELMVQGRIMEEGGLDALTKIMSAATGLTIDELDEMPITAAELPAAFDAIAILAGLSAKVNVPPGEAPAGSGTGMKSMPTSRPALGGRGKK